MACAIEVRGPGAIVYLPPSITHRHIGGIQNLGVNFGLAMPSCGLRLLCGGTI